MMERKEMVQHPQHYVSHPSGVECIEIIRHYTCDIANAQKYLWRAGLKEEEGMTQRQKEIEDCHKAIWYLRDYMQNAAKVQRITVSKLPPHPSGVDCEAIASFYCEEIAQAFREIWFVGLIVDGVLIRPRGEMTQVFRAIRAIERHIVKLLKKDEG